MVNARNSSESKARPASERRPGPPAERGIRSTAEAGVEDAFDAAPEAGQPPAHDDGPLESLGKAISAPVIEAADDEADETPDRS